MTKFVTYVAKLVIGVTDIICASGTIWGQSLEAMQVPPPVKIRFLIFQKYFSQIVQVVFLDIVIFCFSIFLVQLPVAVGEDKIQPKFVRHKAGAFSELSRACLRSSGCVIKCHCVMLVRSKHVSCEVN